MSPAYVSLCAFAGLRKGEAAGVQVTPTVRSAATTRSATAARNPERTITNRVLVVVGAHFADIDFTHLSTWERRIALALLANSKNISMLRHTDNWVAPLYDLATSLVHEKATVDRRVAVSISGERQTSRIRAKQWEKAAQTLKIDPELLISRVRQLATDFPQAFSDVLSDCGGSPAVSEVNARRQTAIADHCSRILAQI